MLSVHEQLDKKVLEIFDALEELYKVQETLEQVMRDGFFHMARARYSMGVKRVSADQILEADMQASRTVLIPELSSELVPSSKISLSDGDSDNEPVSDASSPFQLFTLHKASVIVETSSEIKIPNKQDDDDSGSGLRKRNLTDFEKLSISDHKDNHDELRIKDKEKVIVKEEKTDSEQVDSPKPKKPFNPLNLFGVLVPRELRTSQNQFEEAVSLVVQVSNLQQRLETLQLQYKKLKKMKT